jgi:hypothetical protein
MDSLPERSHPNYNAAFVENLCEWQQHLSQLLVPRFWLRCYSKALSLLLPMPFDFAKQRLV